MPVGGDSTNTPLLRAYCVFPACSAIIRDWIDLQNIMSTQHTIEQKITRELDPLHLEVLNESHMHNVPPGSESHFKVTVVSEKFDGYMLVNRHRMVNEALSEELKGEIHALAMHTMTPEEWFEAGGRSADSPQCRGGSATQNK